MRVIRISIERKVSLWSEGGGRAQEAGKRKGLPLWIRWQSGDPSSGRIIPFEPPPLQGTKFQFQLRGLEWVSNRANFSLSNMVWCDVSISARSRRCLGDVIHPRASFMAWTYSSKVIWKPNCFKSSKVVKEGLLEIFCKSKYVSERWGKALKNILLVALYFYLSPLPLEHSGCCKRRSRG